VSPALHAGPPAPHPRSVTEEGRQPRQGRLKQRQGPATKDEATAPIADAIADFWARDMLTFGIPAHNGGRGPAPEFTKWAGMDAARADLPASHGRVGGSPHWPSGVGMPRLCTQRGSR
jgi:hypothetical protein